jgi:hypothetical protein
MYHRSEKHAQVAAVTNRLIAIDPSNPDNYHLLANAYQGMIGETKDARVKKAYTDSMLKTTTKAERMQAKVVIDNFTQSDADSRVLNGSVENLSDKPADFVLKVEFLDERGSVVETKQETLAAVAPKGSKTFSIAVDKPGVVAYRYAPLTS